MQISKNKSFYKELFILALPIALQSLLSFSLTLTDNIMISSLGEEAVGAVYLASQIQTTLQLLTVGTESVILILASRSLGASDKEGAKKYISLGVLFSLLLSSVFAFLSFFFPETILSLLTDKKELIESGKEYLKISALSFIPYALSASLQAAAKSIKKPKLAFISSFIAFGANLICNTVLIFGKLGFPALGIKGAAISTVAARLLELIFIAGAMLFCDREIKLKPSCIFQIDSKTLKSFFKFGAPVILAQAVWCVNYFFSAGIMGRQRESGALAAVAAASALYNLSYTVTNGMSGAVGIMASRKWGKSEGEDCDMQEFSHSVEIIFIILGILTGLLMQGLKLPFISAWGIAGSARDYALSFVNILSVFVIGTAYQSVALNGIIKSTGGSRFVLFTEAFAVFILIIPLTLLLDKSDANPCLIFAALKCDQIAKCPIAFIKLRKLKSNKAKT